MESVLIPNAVVKVTESGAMITMDGTASMMERRFSYKNRIEKKKKNKDGTKCFCADLAFQVTSAETCVYLMKNRSRCFFTIRNSKALIMINRIND